MKNDLFNKAKDLKHQYDQLYSYRNSLYEAKGCSLGRVKLEFTIGPFNKPSELYFKNIDLIREAVEKEISLVTVELEELQKQFDEL